MTLNQLYFGSFYYDWGDLEIVFQEHKEQEVGDRKKKIT